MIQLLIKQMICENFLIHLLNLENPLKKSYHISKVNKNKSLKYVLDEIGL